MADVIPFVRRSPEAINVAELEPWEQVELFFAQFRHPSMSHRPPDVIADLVGRQLYPYIPADELKKFSYEDLAMRQALLPLSADSDEMDLDALDEFSKQDAIYEDLLALTMKTKTRAKDFAPQRKALLALEDFRLGTKTRSSGDISGHDQDWRHIIKLLFRDSDL